MQGPVFTRNFSSGVDESQTKSIPSVIESTPIPDRKLLRHLIMADGVQINKRNIVQRNKLLWVSEQIIWNFPNRKFKGIIKEQNRVKQINDPRAEDLSGLMQAIQRVIGYGGQYKNFILTLFAVWDGAATVSDSAADIGVTPSQWSQVITIQGEIREINRRHNILISSDSFKNNMSKVERSTILYEHKALIERTKPLLLRLLTLNSSDLNPELNADLDDLFEDLGIGTRVQRRVKRGWYNALARRCLKDIDVDPLNVFGSEATYIINNMKKVDFHEIGELKIGNKVYRIKEDNTLFTGDSKI